MKTGAIDRAALVLGLAAMASSLFALSTGGPAPIDIMHIGSVGVVVVLTMGLIALVGGALRRPALAAVAGAGLVAAALLQLAQTGEGANLLGGNASTVSLMGGLGIALIAVGLTGHAQRRTTPTDATS